MTAAVSSRQNVAEAPSLVALANELRPKQEDAFDFPATLAQRRYWSLHQLKPGGNPALNMTLPVRFHGPLDHDTLRRVLNAIVSRHETLRTAFAVDRGRLRQLVSPEARFDLLTGDAGNLEGENQDRLIAAAAAEEAQVPFDLKSGPLVRARLLRLDGLNNLLLLTVHRLISDDWSNGVLIRDLCVCYEAFVQDRQPSLPELRLQFADYAHWQHARLAANDFAAQRDYWQRQLGGHLPTLSLPVRSSCLTSDSAPVARAVAVLPPDQVGAASALATRRGVAPLVVFLALFNALLYRHTGQSDFLVIVPSPNREHEHFDSIVGPLSNPLLLRADLNGRPNFLELLHRVGRTALDAFANQDVPFELLLDDFNSSQLQVGFVHRSPRVEPATLPGQLSAEPLVQLNGGTLLPLSVAVIAQGNQTRFEFEYDSALFEHETIVQLANDYEKLVRDVVSDPTNSSLFPSVIVSGKTHKREAASQAHDRTRPVKSKIVHPYLGLQLELISIWEDLLGIRGIGIRDNFFQVGGDSLLALRMLLRTERLCGKAILPSSFFAQPTIETLAAEIAGYAIAESSTLVAVHETGSRTPFFYLHGDLFGGGFYALKLSRALGPDQPLYVLPPHDVRDLPAVPTIEQMAAEHLEALRAVRPHGPYIIGGFCLGGTVAYELAQQIRASGEIVEMLLLIDAEPEDKPLRALRHLCQIFGKWFRWDDRSQASRFRQWALLRTKFDLWRKLDLPEQIRAAVRQISNRARLTSRLFGRGAHRALVQDQQSQERDVPTTFLWAAAGYSPKPYSGPVAVFLSEDLMERGDHLACAWQRLAPRATVHLLKGSHLECITAHVDTLAETIDSCLRDLAAKSR